MISYSVSISHTEHKPTISCMSPHTSTSTEQSVNDLGEHVPTSTSTCSSSYHATSCMSTAQLTLIPVLVLTYAHKNSLIQTILTIPVQPFPVQFLPACCPPWSHLRCRFCHEEKINQQHKTALHNIYFFGPQLVKWSSDKNLAMQVSSKIKGV